MEPHFFRSQAEFRKWLARNHDKKDELIVGYWKVDSGKGGITYSESLEEALCFGWIDGVRRKVDDTSYTVRFTPRKPGSIWSAVNIRKVKALIEAGRMMPPGLSVFEARDEKRAERYSYERENATLPPELEQEFRSNVRGWNHFIQAADGYRRLASWYVMSAVRPETRAQRLRKLIAVCEEERLKEFLRPGKKESAS